LLPTLLLDLTLSVPVPSLVPIVVVIVPTSLRLTTRSIGHRVDPAARLVILPTIISAVIVGPVLPGSAIIVVVRTPIARLCLLLLLSLRLPTLGLDPLLLFLLPALGLRLLAFAILPLLDLRLLAFTILPLLLLLCLVSLTDLLRPLTSSILRRLLRLTPLRLRRCPCRRRAPLDRLSSFLTLLDRSLRRLCPLLFLRLFLPLLSSFSLIILSIVTAATLCIHVSRIPKKGCSADRDR
jgi:hypothetical protein